MRLRYIQVNGKLIPADEVTMKTENFPAIHGIKEPFVSMADGKTYTSYSQYEREVHARGCEIIGDEIKHLMKPREIPDVAPQQRKELIVAQIQELGHDGVKKALKRDIDFVKWNSRGLSK